jgi:hypothetical protein
MAEASFGPAAARVANVAEAAQPQEQQLTDEHQVDFRLATIAHNKSIARSQSNNEYLGSINAATNLYVSAHLFGNPRLLIDRRTQSINFLFEFSVPVLTDTFAAVNASRLTTSIARPVQRPRWSLLI